jgi:hypothetical protein
MTQDAESGYITIRHIRAIDTRLTALETRDAVDQVHREHIEKRLDHLDTKLAAISIKVDEGFEKVYSSLRKPIMTVTFALLAAIVAWIVNGGLAI